MKDKLLIVLASASPRRRELLEQIGLDFIIIPSSCKEEANTNLPKRLVLDLSKQKALDVSSAIFEDRCERQEKERLKQAGKIIVLGADTIVSYKGQILQKPKDENEAKTMLKLLSDNEHEVYTGVCLICIENKNNKFKYMSEPIINFCESTRVYFDKLSDEDIEEYIKTKESFDKAGAYAIQGIAAKYIKKIDGDYNNVVGLPLAKLWYYIKNIS